MTRASVTDDEREFLESIATLGRAEPELWEDPLAGNPRRRPLGAGARWLGDPPPASAGL